MQPVFNLVLDIIQKTVSGTFKTSSNKLKQKKKNDFQRLIKLYLKDVSSFEV